MCGNKKTMKRGHAVDIRPQEIVASQTNMIVQKVDIDIEIMRISEV